MIKPEHEIMMNIKADTDTVNKWFESQISFYQRMRTYTTVRLQEELNKEEIRSYKELYWCDHIINHEPYSLDKKLSNDIPGIYITFQKVPENVVKEIQRRKVQEKLSEILQENS